MLFVKRRTRRNWLQFYVIADIARVRGPRSSRSFGIVTRLRAINILLLSQTDLSDKINVSLRCFRTYARKY